MSWSFKDRLDTGRHNVIRIWLDAQPLKVRLKFDLILRNLAVSERLGRPFLKKVKGYQGVFEVVISSNKVQYRPLGGYGPKQGEFTFVMGAIEHNDNIRPPDAFGTAERLIDGLGTITDVCDHDYEKPAPEVTQRLI